MIAIHAGHAPHGVRGCGAVGNIKSESELNRIFVAAMKEEFFRRDVDILDSTVEFSATPNFILESICTKENNKKPLAGFSIHYNASPSHTAQRTEILIHPNSKMNRAFLNLLGKTIADAQGIAYGGIVERTNLYYLNHTKHPSCIIEVAFCDNMTQHMVTIQHAVGVLAADEICNFYGFPNITGDNAGGNVDADAGVNVGTGTGAGTGTSTGSTARTLYKVQVGAFEKPENATKLCEELSKKGYQAMVTKVTNI